jgi:hypothetical protein
MQFKGKAMLQIWEYETPTGTYKGVFANAVEFTGTDLSYSFYRLDENGKRGPVLDVVRGERLKAARRIGSTLERELT